MERLGTCPNCQAKEKFGWLTRVVPSRADLTPRARCGTCRHIYTLGNHGTLAVARRRQGAISGWQIRKHQEQATSKTKRKKS